MKAESGFSQSLRMTEEITKENNSSIYISGVKRIILSLLNTKNIKKDLDSRLMHSGMTVSYWILDRYI